MESINLLVQKYILKVELSIKLLPYSPQSNEKTNIKRNYGFIIYQLGFTTKLMWRNNANCKREKQKVFSFQKESNFVCSRQNLFHKRNRKKGNSTRIISKCGGFYPKYKFLFLKLLKYYLRMCTVNLDLNSLVKCLNDLWKHKRRMYLIKGFRDVVNVKGYLLPSNMILLHFLCLLQTLPFGQILSIMRLVQSAILFKVG